MLDVPSALLRPWQAERLTAEQRDRFRLGLFQAARGRLGVSLGGLGSMAEQDVREFVKERFVRPGIDVGDRHFPMACVPHRVAVDRLERNLGDVES